MLTIINALRNLKILSDTRGQGLAEYGLILGLVAVAAIVGLGVIAASINGTLQVVAGKL